MPFTHLNIIRLHIIRPLSLHFLLNLHSNFHLNPPQHFLTYPMSMFIHFRILRLRRLRYMISFFTLRFFWFASAATSQPCPYRIHKAIKHKTSKH
eukprot:UN04409